MAERLKRERRIDREAAERATSKARALIGYLFVADPVPLSPAALRRLGIDELRALAIEHGPDAPHPPFAARALDLLDEADELLGR